MEIVQVVFNAGVVAYVVVSTIIWRNQIKINSNNITMASLLDQRVRELEIAEELRKKV